MKLVLAGGYDTSNLGDHAMLHVLKTTLSSYEKTGITILSRHLEKSIEEDYGVKLIKNLDYDTKQESIGKWFNGFNFGDDTKHIQRISKELKNADALVIGGGRLLIDICLDFMRGPLPYFVLLTTIAKFLDLPIIIYAMTIVEPETVEGKKMLKFIIENANLVMVREQPSKDVLDNLNIKYNNLHIIPDPAFALEKIDRSQRAKEIFEKEKLNFNEAYIGLNLRYTNLTALNNDEKYIDKLASICDIIYERYNAKILLISQMNYNTDNKFDDDRNLYKLILKKVKNKENIFMIEGKYNIFDTLAIYQKIDRLFSMRRHGLIFAATQGIPVYGLIAENNTKYAMQEMDIEKNIIDINSNIKLPTFDNLLSKDITLNVIRTNVEQLSKCNIFYRTNIIQTIKG
jgi:polysaccharide pyruvyl transferase WcaK-like protein